MDLIDDEFEEECIEETIDEELSEDDEDYIEYLVSKRLDMILG